MPPTSASTPLRLGTRGSRLALWQAHWVRDALAAVPGAPPVEIVRIETAGDRIQNVALSAVGGRDFFTKDIESALLDGRVDFAVHSLKDLATEQPDGLGLGAVMKRADPRDAVVVGTGAALETLQEGATIGTSSLRRKAFLAALYPRVRATELRGNVPTRLARLDEGLYDGILLAAAGLDRLGLGSRITSRLDPERFTPAPAQGAVGVQVRIGDDSTRRWIGMLEHGPTRRETDAERRLLRVLEGGCQVPVGALARVEGDRLHLTARVASLDGATSLSGSLSGSTGEAERLGETLALRLIDDGAADILAAIRARGLGTDAARADGPAQAESQ
jgi:hydroxymethylbilane synthase